MQYYDFSRSFITFRLDLDEKPPSTLSHEPHFRLNNARILVECCCKLIHRKSGMTSLYVLGASCKTERVGVTHDIWTQPNADFSLIVSEQEFLILKSWQRNNPGVMFHPPSLGPQPERQVGKVNDVWTSLRIDLYPLNGRVLDSKDAIIEATFGNRRLVGTIEYEEGDYCVCITHPIKTINVNERDHIIQTDTGPIILPDLSPERLQKSKYLVETFDLAYAAFNNPAWAEFIIQVPTPIGDGVFTNHYSKTRRIENTKNTVIEI
ncbi:MAG TPA: hypothetical protein VNJ09_04910 [Chthonomonadales bacterium]|nr:hypothetical protein [Chthonomonadales bacterium]